MPEDYYRRNLPHIEPFERDVFVTFCTYERWIIPKQLRLKVLEHCLHDHQAKILADCVVVMPDHVHMIFSILQDEQGIYYPLRHIMQAIKSASAHSINKLLKRKGTVWQDESVDHIIRSDLSIREKSEYVCMNPVRKGLVESPDDYPWLWRSWIEGIVK